MKTANQLTFTTYEASLKLKPDDPIKVIFDNIDWSFVHPLVQGKYSNTAQGADGYDPISLLKSQLLNYLGEVSSDRRLVSALRYNARLCLLCGFNFLKTPSNGTFTNFRDRLGEDLFYEILHQLIAQAIVLKVIIGGDTAIDSTHLWAYSNKSGKKSCLCKGKCSCPRVYSDTDASWGHKSKEYAFFGYKVHLIVDARSPLPLDVRVTPASDGDSPQAKPLLKGVKEKHPDHKIGSVATDSAYDAYENYHFVIHDIGAAPIIALNTRNGPDALTVGSLCSYPRKADIPALPGFKSCTGVVTPRGADSSSVARQPWANASASFGPPVLPQATGEFFTFILTVTIAWWVLSPGALICGKRSTTPVPAWREPTLRRKVATTWQTSGPGDWLR